MTEGPYFIVLKGTNKRWEREKQVNIYDTKEIAQKEIDHGTRDKGLPTSEPISVTEYDRKYAALMKDTEEE